MKKSVVRLRICVVPSCAHLSQGVLCFVLRFIIATVDFAKRKEGGLTMRLLEGAEKWLLGGDRKSVV